MASKQNTLYNIDNTQGGYKMTKTKFSKRLLSAFLCVVLIFTCLPFSAMAASASSDYISRVADLSTMDAWKDYFLPEGKISTENAGGVWTDKSVFTDDGAFASNGITMDNDDAFLVALSAMASNMTVTGMSHVPTDTMLILDVSASMGPGQNNVASELIEAANTSIASLLSTNSHSRVGVVLYSGPTTQGGAATDNDAVLVLPLARYETQNDVYLNFSNNQVSINNNVVYEGTTNKPTAKRKSVSGGTYIQKGVILAKDQLTADGLDTTINDDVLGTIKRKPVMVLMSDGAPTFSSTNFQNPTSINLGDGTATSAAQGFVNQLTAAYAKKQVEEKYDTSALFYTIGLGVSNDAVAVSVLDPDNKDASVAINDFWSQWNRVAVGRSVTVQSATWWSEARTVTKIDGLEQNYVDDYINVENDNSNVSVGERLKQAFADIVGKINLQSKYTPTLISQTGENHSGFISFVDKIGEYMQVTDIKGIVINNKLYSGADLASNFVTGGGNLGTFDNPTELGHEMVAAVRQRIGLANDDEARTLIGLAYEYGQIRYSSVTDYSNYIGWYADKNNKFLGFYQDGVTNITNSEAVYTIKSYGYLGVEHDSNMMYATVQVRHNIKTGEETLAFAVPAALIPVMTYNVSLDSQGELTNVETSGSESPIRLVYEVALDSHINEWNVKDVVSADYLADQHNINADGSINFYSNDWEHTNSTGYNTVNTYSYFNPSRQNEEYYYTADASVYTDENGTLYEGASAPNTNGTYYRAYTVYEKDGSAQTKKTVYRRLSVATLETAKKTDGTNTWYIPNGNVHVNLDGYTVNKQQNKTATLNVAYQPFVDVYGHNVNDVNHSFYVGATLGNNGKLTLKTQTGIKLSKTMANGATATDELFSFELDNMTSASSEHAALLIDVDGTETVKLIKFDSNGKVTVELKAGQTLYIGDMENMGSVTVKEIETAAYIPTVTVNGAVADNPATVTITNNQISDVAFVNADRGTGNLTVAKQVEHDFGVDYQIPANKLFTVKVTLSGIGTANATFDAAHTLGTYSDISTDANGSFTVTLAHGQQFEVFGLPAGTVATVVETEYGSGFTPIYWDNGVQGDGQVTIAKDTTSSVIVINDYQAAEVYPVNISVSGSKVLKNQIWQPNYSFEFKLQKLQNDGNWQDLATATATYNSATFDFDNAFDNELYTEAGTYYYRIIEIEPATALGGFTYDKTVHSFSVIVGDTNMDGKLEITNVVASRPETTEITNSNGDWNVNAEFTNVYSASGSATVTIDLNKEITNIGGSDKSLAGYTFGLYEGNTLVRTSAATTDRGFARMVLTYNADEMNASTEIFEYVLKEIAPNPLPNGWTYSTKEVAVTVEVKDNFDGTISAVIYTGDQKPANAGTSIEETFTNTYNPDDAELPINFVSKKISGRELKSTDNFTFEVQKQDGTTVLTGSNNGTQTVTFNDTLKFSEVGSYFYNIVETSASGNGITVDNTVYRMIVNVTDVDGELVANYSIVNVVGNNIVFTNVYKAAETTYAIGGTKKLTGRTLLNDEFTFVLTEALNANGDIANGAKTYETHNEFEGRFEFPEITYTKAGNYYYVVSEKRNGGSSYGIKYDTNTFVVTVTVKDDTENGRLVATANLDADDIIFNNQYVAEPVSKRIDGEKILNGKTLVLGQFSFELWQSNAEWGYVNSTPIQTVKNDGQGGFAFGFVDYNNSNATDFTKVGNYYYLIKEVNGGQTIKGITYDDTVYRVRVEITDDLKGLLHATAHIYDNAGVPQQAIVFRNSYEITGDTDLEINGTKKLDNKIPQNRTFEFELYKANAAYEISGNYIQKVTQDLGGNFKFSINYKPKDISDTPYYYVVKEVNGGQKINGITYDNTKYHIEVKVEDNGEGGVKSTAIIRKGQNVVTSLDFANTYKADPTTVVFDGKKELKGNRKVKAGDYTFEIFNANENFDIVSSAAPAVKNDANREFEFAEITLDTAKNYYFVAKENSANALNGVTYDTSEYHITVKVVDNNQGKLVIDKITYTRVKGNTSTNANSILFENSYKASNATVSIGGKKLLKNRTLAENEFKFLLYSTDDTYAVAQNATAKEAKNKADGSFTFDAITFEEIGKYYFVIIEDPDTTAERVTNDTAEYHVVIEIKDDEDGKLYEASRAITKVGSNNAVEDIEFNNIFTPKPEDITVDISVAKTVVNKGSEKIGPEGFEFVLENIATKEKFNIKTDALGKALFTLGYTEDDIGKTYTYKLTEVNGGKANVSYSKVEYTVTVTISLNQNNELVATLTKNGANATVVVAEFENVYDYTPTGNIPNIPSSPQTGARANLNFLFALLFVSGTAFTVDVYKAKKRAKAQ